jgi:hypothetical protein
VVEHVNPKDDAVTELVEKSSALLDRVVLDEYYGPPGTLDDAIAALLAALAGATTGDWDAFARSLIEQRHRVIGRYALRAPMVALRTNDVQHLSTGLLAHCAIRRTVPDWRDDLVFFAPYVHVASTLGLDVTEHFDRAARHAVPELASVMQQFGRRRDVTLGAFGWREIDTADGPTFESLNWKTGPSGAVVGERSWNEINEAQMRELMEWIGRHAPQVTDDRGPADN